MSSSDHGPSNNTGPARTYSQLGPDAPGASQSRPSLEVRPAPTLTQQISYPTNRQQQSHSHASSAAASQEAISVPPSVGSFHAPNNLSLVSNLPGPQTQNSSAPSLPGPPPRPAPAATAPQVIAHVALNMLDPLPACIACFLHH